jgi:hypothetical protein
VLPPNVAPTADCDVDTLDGSTKIRSVKPVLSKPTVRLELPTLIMSEGERRRRCVSDGVPAIAAVTFFADAGAMRLDSAVDAGNDVGAQRAQPKIAPLAEVASRRYPILRLCRARQAWISTVLPKSTESYLMRVELPTPASRAALDVAISRQFDVPPTAVWGLGGSTVEIALDRFQLAHALCAEQQVLARELQQDLADLYQGGEPRNDWAHASLVQCVEGLTTLLEALFSSPSAETRRAV